MGPSAEGISVCFVGKAEFRLASSPKEIIVTGQHDYRFQAFSALINYTYRPPRRVAATIKTSDLKEGTHCLLIKITCGTVIQTKLL